MALIVGVSGVSCAAGVDRMCTWSGKGAAASELLVAWAVALGFNFVGSGLRIGFWGFSPAPFSLPSSLNKGRISSLFSHGQLVAPMIEDSDNPSEYSTKFSISSSCSCCLQCSSTVVSIRHSSFGLSSS